MKNIIVLTVLVSSICSSQNNFTFPFSTTDKYEYDIWSAFSGFPIGKLSFQPGKDTLMPNNKTYKSFAMFYFRKDGQKVYQYIAKDSSEFTRYDFSKQKGDTVTFIKRGNDSFVVTVYDDLIKSVLGQARRTLIFHSKDGSIWEGVADSIGILSFSNVIDMSYELSGAVISGKVFGTIASVHKQESLYPLETNISQNYPNPFNPTTTLRYSISKNSIVKIAISNLIGQQVAILVNTYKEAGSYNIDWNASNYSSGTYLCTMTIDNYTKTVKLNLLK